MNQNEWLDYFETVNGRKPSPQEFAQAKAAGEFTSTNEPTAVAIQHNDEAAGKKGPSKKAKIVLVLVGAVLLLAAGSATYVWWRYSHSKITDGTWLIQSEEYYDDKKKKWVDAIKQNKESNLDYELLDYITVSNNRLKTYTYFDYGTSTELVSYIDYNTGDNYQIDTWNQRLTLTMSQKEYDRKVSDILDKIYDNTSSSSEDIQDYKDDYSESYADSLKCTYRYTVKNNVLTLTIYDEDNKKTEVRTYKKITGDEEDKLLYDYKKSVEDDKELHSMLKEQ